MQKRKFKDEFIRFIKDNVLIEDLAQNVYALQKNRKKSTTAYPVYVLNDDKIIINNRKNMFTTASNAASGSVIDFVQFIENVDFVEAVKKIASYYNLDVDREIELETDNSYTYKYNNNVNNINKELRLNKEATKNAEIKLNENEEYLKKLEEHKKIIEEIKKRKEQELKEKEEKAKKEIEIYKRLQSDYFTRDIRGISSDLLNFLVKEGRFVYYKKSDYIKVPIFDDNLKLAGVQNIFYSDKEKSWRKINYGKSGIFGIVNRNNEKVVLTESFFDSLSALQLAYNNKTAENPFYEYEDIIQDLGTISINGSLNEVKKQAIINLLKKLYNVNQIILAFDNDEAGKKYEKEITELLKENEMLNKYKILSLEYGQHKDLNELLQAQQQQQQQNNIVKKIEKQHEEIAI